MGRGVFGESSRESQRGCTCPGEAAAARQSRLHRGLSLLRTSRAQWGEKEADVKRASAFPSRFRDLDEYEKQKVGLAERFMRHFRGQDAQSNRHQESAAQIGSILPVQETMWDRNSEFHGVGGADGVVQEAVHISAGRALMIWPRNQVRASSYGVPDDDDAF